MAKSAEQRRQEAEDKVAAEWASQVRPEVLDCRHYGHLWNSGLHTLYKVDGDYVRQLGCGRCGMIRRDATPIGEYGAVRRQYIPPPDYRRDKGDDGSVRIPRYVVAQAIVDQAVVENPTPDILDWHQNRRQW